MGLTSFMNENTPTYGSITTSVPERIAYAKKSKRFNLRNPKFCELFEELTDQLKKEIAEEDKLSNSSKSDLEKDKASK